MKRVPRADRHRVNVTDLLASVDRRMTTMGIHPDDKRKVMEIVRNSCEELVLLNTAQQSLQTGIRIVGSRPRLAQWQKDIMETGYTPF